MNRYVLLSVVMLRLASGAIAADGTWNVDSGGNWSGTANWSGSIVADGADFTATFPDIITANRYVNCDVDRTIGGITFVDTSHDLIISNNTMTLDVTSGMPTINVSGGSGRILYLRSIVAGNDGLAKSGSGILSLNGANTFSGDISISGGTLEFDAIAAWGGSGKNVIFGGSANLGGTDGYTAGTVTVSNGFTATIESTFTITAATGSGRLEVRSSGKTLSILDGSGFTGTLANMLSYQGKDLQFKSLADSAGAGNIQFGGGSSDGGQDGIIRLYGDVGPLTLNYRQIEVTPKTANHGFETIKLENNNATAANKWVINTDFINNEIYRQKILILGGINTGDNEFAGSIPDGGNKIVLKKQDAGKWILSGTNTYSGATTVSAGELALSVGGHCSNSVFTVSGGALSVQVTNNTMQTIVKSLTFSSEVNFDFDFGSVVPSGSTAPLMVTGNVNFASSPTINCTGAGVAGLAPGSYPLIKYTGTLSGSPTAGTLGNTGGMLVVDTAGKTIWLYVAESVQPLTWQGPAASEWKANEPTYTYWQDASPVTTNYREYAVGGATSGDNVVFDDNGPGGTVTLNTSVSPSKVTSAGTSDYSISGAGSISGSGQLKVTGSGTLTLATSNSFSGSVDMTAGTLALTDTNAIGSSAAMTLAAGAAIHLKSDNDATFNTPDALLSISTHSSISIDVDNNGSGSGKTLAMTGSLELESTANNVNSTVNVTSGNDYALILDELILNTPQWTPVNYYLVPAGANLEVGTVTRAGTGRCRLYLRGWSATTNAIGSLPYVTEEMELHKDTASTWKVGDIKVYDWDITISAGTVLATGTLDVTSSAQLLLNGGELHLNNAGAVKATAGSPWKIAGGNIENSSGAAISTSTYNPAMQWNSDFTFIGANGANSDLNLGSGAVAMNASRTITIQNADATLTVGGAISGTGYSLIKAGPGTLKLSGANTFSGDTTISAGTLETSGNGTLGNGSYSGNIVNNALLKHSSSVNQTLSGVISGTGGLIKQGTGILTLSGANTYSGSTVISSGVLKLTGSGSIDSSPNVTIASGCTLDATNISSHVMAAGAQYTLINSGTDSGAISADALDISNANVTISNTPSSGVVLATYTSLSGSAFATTNGVPAGWRIDYSFNGNQIVLVRESSEPSVINNGATSLSQTSASLTGLLTNGGSAAAWICWGTNDGGTEATSSWQNVTPVGDVMQDTAFSVLAANLATNATYWHRCYVTNADGNGWSPDATTFSGTPTGGGGSGYSLQITFTNFAGRETLTNFPALVKFTPENVGYYEGFLDTTNGWDLRFWPNASLKGSELDYETEKWNGSYISSPTDISGCVLWLDSGNGVLTSGSAVTNWADQSGNGHDVSQLSASEQPSYVASVVNGRPVVRFVATDYLDRSDALGFTGNAAMTVFVVTEADDTSTMRFLQLGQATGAVEQCIAFVTDSSVRYNNGNEVFANDSLDSGFHIAAYAVPAGGDYISPTFYKDGVEAISTSSNNASSKNLSDELCRVGAGVFGASPNNALSGDVAEIIVYDSVLSDAEIRGVGSYLDAKYNLNTAYDDPSYVWVKIPELTNNLSIWASWGDAANANQEAYTTNGDVWSEGFEGVWHLGSDTEDSTANQRDGVNVGTTNAPGHIGDAQGFDGASVITMTGYKGVTGTDSRTCSAWIKTSQADDAIINWGSNTPGGKWTFRTQDDNGATNTLRIEVNGGYQIGSTEITDDQWRLVNVVLDSDGTPDAEELVLYVDGFQEVYSDTNAQSISTASSQDVRIGDDFNGTRQFDGSIDEVRISSVKRSSNWVWACWMNQGGNHDSFVEYGTPVVGGAIENLAPTNILASSANLNASLVASPNTNYAVYVHFGTSDGGTNFGWSGGSTLAETVTNLTSTNETYAISYPKAGLKGGRAYWYTFRASNDAGNAWASPSWTFTTAPPTGGGSVFMFK